MTYCLQLTVIMRVKLDIYSIVINSNVTFASIIDSLKKELVKKIKMVISCFDTCFDKT